MSAAVGSLEIDAVAGRDEQDGADRLAVIETTVGPIPLDILCRSRQDVQQLRLSMMQRGMDPRDIDGLRLLEDRMSRQIGKALREHVLWPWLAPLKGLGGVQVARLIALIDDPFRFPGRLCGAGHHHSAAGPPSEIEEQVGCGIEQADGTVCAAPVGPLRRGTGVRSLWHYLGLHVVNGRSPRKTKGQRADWNPVGRTICLMPGGIADSIVKARTPVYRDTYDAAKARLTETRAVAQAECDVSLGAQEGAEAVAVGASDPIAGLRPFQIDNIAKKIAVKAFVGDLLMEWKRRAEVGRETEPRLGPASPSSTVA